jgi:hypothetical protein
MPILYANAGKSKNIGRRGKHNTQPCSRPVCCDLIGSSGQVCATIHFASLVEALQKHIEELSQTSTSFIQKPKSRLGCGVRLQKNPRLLEESLFSA